MSAMYFLFIKSRGFRVILNSANVQVIQAAYLKYVLQSQLRCWHHRRGGTANGKDLNLTRISNITVFETEVWSV